MRLFAFALTTFICASAFAQSTEAIYAQNQGDGIRAYSESRYDDALDHLYRAFSVKPNQLTLKLIVRSHDFQGNCSARDNAASMLVDLFPRQSVPPAQRCAQVGELVVHCANGAARIDRAFDVPCNTPIRIPIGAHEVSLNGTSFEVAIVSGETVSAGRPNAPGKWYFAERQRQVVQLPKRWLRPGLLVDPDMPRTFEWKRPRILENATQ